VNGVAWWFWGDPVAHARPAWSRGSRAICGAHLPSRACLNIGIRPLCGECVAILTGLKECAA
jgi:hypothetical protein